MNKEFKRSFFMCLLAVLLVVSNLIGLKYTNFLDITIGVDFVTFPFTFLCTLLIMNLGGKRDAFRSILVASIIQLLITISYALATSLGTQSLMPDAATYVNQVFKVNELNILASVLAFGTSHCLLIYIYDNFKHYGKELYGLAIGLLGALFLNSVIYLGITLHMYEPIYIINMLLSNVIIDIVMIIIIIILFYILRDPKEKIITYRNSNNTVSKDLGTEEVIENKKVVRKPNTSKSNTQGTKKANNNYKKTGTKTTKSNANKKTNTVKKSKETK